MPESIRTEHALTTLATVKGELGLDEEDTSKDAILERLINVVSESIERKCGRHFEYTEEIEELVAGQGGPRIMLSRTPVVDVDPVSIDGAGLDPTEYVLESAETGMLYRSACWPWSGLCRRGI